MRKMSLRKVIEGAGLGLGACADVIGVDRQLFQQWADGQKEMPPVYASILAATLGVRTDALTSKALLNSKNASRVEPAAIWFKFRGNAFKDVDRESILTVRRLGHNANQLEQATLGQTNKAWDVMFQKILLQVDLQSSPRDQGKAAARAFCEFNQVGHAGTSSTEIMRARLRAQGVLLIESPIADSQIEGCSFYVGDSTAQRPCIFVNTYKTTWFRRNVLIMHELAHAIFDQATGGEIDVLSESSSLERTSVSEVRADVFARETLLPEKLLHAVCHRLSIKPTSLTVDSLAALVAETGIEKKTVVQVLSEYGLIDDVLADLYLSYDIAEQLRELTSHALSTEEYISKIGKEAAAEWENKRYTTIAKRNLLLPVPYIKAVLDAVKSFNISLSRAAELLMIDEQVFAIRFPALAAEVSE